MDNTIVFLFAAQKRVKLAASINKQRKREGGRWKKKNGEREECVPINTRV